MKKLNIMYLCGNVDKAENSAIAEEMRKRGHNPMVKDVKNLFFQVSNKIGHDKLFETTTEGAKRIYSKNVDVVLWRAGGTPREHGRRIIDYFRNLNIPTTHSSQAIYNCSDKLRATFLTSLHKIKTPKTTALVKSMKFGEVVKLTGGKLPLIGKTVTGSQGSGVFWLADAIGAKTTLETLFKLDAELMVQEYIQTAKENEDKEDVRVFIVDNEVVASMKRFSKGKDFRANYTISQKAEKVELTDEQKEMALKAAKAVSCSGICGVDMLTHYETDIDYIIEQNSNPGMKIQTITRIDISGKIVDFLERLAAGTANIQDSNFSNPVEPKNRLSTNSPTTNKPSWQLLKEKEEVKEYGRLLNDYERKEVKTYGRILLQVERTAKIRAGDYVH